MMILLGAGSVIGCAVSFAAARFYFAGKVEKDQHGLLMLWVMLSLLLPFIGFIFGFILLRLFVKNQDGSFMDEYSSYIQNKVYNFENLRETLNQDRQLLSASGYSSGNGWMMKSLLLNMSNEKTISQEKIIKKGLNHPDREAVHYAATITNVLQDRLANQITQQKRDLSAEHPITYQQLLSTYKEYLSSELLSSAIREKTELDYEGFLREAAAEFPEDFQYREALGMLIFEKNPQESEQIFQSLLHEQPQSAQVMWGWLQISYQNGSWDRVFELAVRLRNHPDINSFPIRQQKIIQYLGGNNR
ncbi:hypothetical protein CEF21_17475 [Bacillus sp. FJAT-42376]|uniref:hypothetical protein n=1 Tax=Bacillus sp. FJAT-42376 TaxID=2014076 RepID=UPI000F4E84DE|nr:hypothetical protein [Bacillus sp. FJAT-42376]AZB43959.1 hypothetical protein CEF21_17475 [Bacillus sp. FJAT-42376]